ncbi:hypothetical protein [Sediminibacterium sp. C3]|uniref:hypothetical protein n=1 Tax=Sediminibacterium sp. C3 TaxID=1267211 RepID=UPI0012697B10|nr:hypothetical protein [Sediminibacterium sp. C3]
MVNRNTNFILLILQFSAFVILLSCNGDKRQIKFDKNKWGEQADPLFPSPYRSRMLTDLTMNYNLKGLKYSKLTELLGVPDIKDSSSLTYRILIDYKQDIDPVYTKDLKIFFSKDDSVITSFTVSEWKKQ